jgi:AraC-like DNA-binding protein
MELFQDKHSGVKLLEHLYAVLTTQYPSISPSACGLHCNLETVAWWKGESASPMQDFISLLRYICGEHSSEIVYKIVQRAHLTDLGMMGYAMMTTRNLYEFVAIASHALRQFDYPVEVSIQDVDADTAYIGFTDKFDDKAYYDSFIEFSMALSWHYIQIMHPAGKSSRPEAIHFAFAGQHSCPQVLEKFYGTKASYNQKHNAILIPKASLSSGLTTASLDDFIECTVQSNQILSKLGNKSSFQYKVEQALIEAPNICQFSFTLTADYLGLSTRQLRTRLENENTSFRKTALNVRMRLAQEYLKSTRLPIQQVAYILWYKEPNNFIRTFKNTFAISPKQYRETFTEA